MPDASATPRLTVIFPVYRAEDAVAGLVESVVRQRPPDGADPARWLEVLFIDNASPDDTVAALERALAAAVPPFPVRVVRNEENIGLARSFNRALGMVTTEYVLTCHADCRFGSDDYLTTVIDLLDRHPDVAVVSGQSIADVDAGLSQVEKVYLAANLMDVFPDGEGELEPLGFAEGRCDGFRLEAMRAAGFYDTTLKRAGEDQLLSAAFRANGYRVCRAPRLRYFLSVSSDQDSLMKLVRHAQLFGRVTPYLLLANRGTLAGIAGGQAGRNRTLRTTLRVLHLVSAAGWIAVGVSIVARRSPLPGAAAIVLANLVKAGLFRRYVVHLRFSRRDVAALAALQPALDIAYTYGLAKGMTTVTRRGEGAIS